MESVWLVSPANISAHGTSWHSLAPVAAQIKVMEADDVFTAAGSDSINRNVIRVMRNLRGLFANQSVEA